MCAVTRAGGRVILPDVKNDPLFRRIKDGVGDTGPATGSLPNRFKAEIPDSFDPGECREAILKTWRGITDQVWRRFIDGPVALRGCGTDGIWNRQIDGFWDIAWVTGANPGDGKDLSWLDRRKNWRTHRPPVEGGDHCMLMGDWQELSGFIRARERNAQDEFWDALKARTDTGNRLNLEKNERLCAIALVKRLFPEVAKTALGWEPSWNGETVRWPSTPRLAAAEWLRYAWKEARAEATAFIAECGSRLPEPELEAGNKLSQVSGALLHRNGIESAHSDELPGSAANAKTTRQKLRDAHKALVEIVGEPSAFYTLLLMDALSEFSAGVDEIIRQRGGHTVYAGGDDVLALLPIEGAITAAIETRKAYRSAFASNGLTNATISAAIVFAHFHAPLRGVLREAHRQLDNIAKKCNGRDSLALCVLTQGGMNRAWVSCFETAGLFPPGKLLEGARTIEAHLSGRFLYAIQTRYEEILGDLGEKDAKRILRAEYEHSGGTGSASADDTEKLIDNLYFIAVHHPGPDHADMNSAKGPSMEGPLIARFLAREGLWI